MAAETVLLRPAPTRIIRLLLCLGAAAFAAAPQGPIKITVSCASGPSLVAGTSTQCNATKTFVRGRAVPGSATQTLFWSSSSTPPGIVNVSNASGQQGSVSALAPGTAHIVAASGPFRGEYVITVTAPVLVSITVSPPNANLPLSGAQSFTATGHLSNGQTTSPSVTWSSSVTSVATINSSSGAASAVKAGSTTITAHDPASGLNASAGLNVGLDSIAISPVNPPAVALGLTQPFTAMGTFGATQQDVTNFVLWDATDHGIATLSSSGLASTIGQGSTTVTATSGAAFDSTTLMVGPPALAAVNVLPSYPVMVVGESLQFQALASYTDSSVADVTSQASWNSTNTSAATVTTSGLVTAAGTGNSDVTAMFSGVTGTSHVSVRPASRFLLAANPTDSTVSAYSLDEIGGHLRSQSYALVSGAKQLGNIAVSPDGARVYVPDAGGSGIYGFSVDLATARLQRIANSPFAGGSGPSCVAISPSGTFAYATNAASSAPGVVSAYFIDQKSGALLPQTPIGYATGNFPACAAVDLSGNFLYVTNSGPGTVTVFKIASDGSLTKANSVSTGGSKPGALAFDPSGKFLLVANSASASAAVFSINSSTGALSPVGSPVATGTSPASIAFDPAGTHVYVENSGSNSISGFSFNASTGAMVALTDSPFALSGSPATIATDAAGEFLFASIPANNEIVQFAIAANGHLNLVHDQRSRGGVASLALTSGSAVKYAPVLAEIANQGTGAGVSSYSIDPASGALSPVDGAQIGTNGAFGIATDPFGRFTFATNDPTFDPRDPPPAGTVSAFTLSSGFLTNGSSLATQVFPNTLASEPSGRFLYVVNGGSNTVSSYGIDQSTGALTSISTAATAPQPKGMAADPTGRFVYVTSANGTGTDSVNAYVADASSGNLTAVTGSPFALSLAFAPVVHPSGKFLYVVSGNGINTLQPFAIDSASGALTELGSAVGVGVNPSATAIDGDGRFLYVANTSDNTVSAFAIAANGTLSPIAGSPFATSAGPDGLTVDASGRFLYVTGATGNAVSIFSIDSATGALSNRNDLSVPANPIGISLTQAMN